MIKQLFVSSTLGLVGVIFGYICDKYVHDTIKKPFVYFVFFIVLSILATYAFPCNGEMYISDQLAKDCLDFQFPHEEFRSGRQHITLKQQYETLAEHHRMLGRQCYEDADAMNVYIPQLFDRENVKLLFRSCITSICAGTPQKIAIAFLAQCLAEYGINTWDRYEAHQQLLKEAAWHYAERDRYAQLAAIS